MRQSNEKKKVQLGMHIGTASSILRKNIMFSLVQKLNMDFCFQCGAKIESVTEFSIEHKVPYLDSDKPVELFFDLNNISFSHLDCNVNAARKQRRKAIHGTRTKYLRGCRCQECKKANSTYKKSLRTKHFTILQAG